MKIQKILLSAVFLSFSVNSYADANAVKLLDVIVKVKPEAIQLKDTYQYISDDQNNYSGRNNNRIKDNFQVETTSSNSLSRSVTVNTNSKDDSQIENFESTAGELIQKVEDDRIKRSKDHEGVFTDNKSTLKASYDILKEVKVNNLGSEQDPSVQNAFKCEDLISCNKNPDQSTKNNDTRAINSCSSNERLHWNGKKWACKGIFEVVSSSSCTSRQYEQSVNGAKACIDYIYFWKATAKGSCVDNAQQYTVKCNSKKTVDSTVHSEVSDSECIGTKPKSTQVC